VAPFLPTDLFRCHPLAQLGLDLRLQNPKKETPIDRLVDNPTDLFVRNMGSDTVKDIPDSAMHDANTMTDRTTHSQSQEEARKFEFRIEDDADPNEVENIYGYVPGGYHPVALGDALGDGGRFRVVHKLGFGGYATVWLCHDTISKKWRAVKIIAADASNPECPDLKALELFAGLDPGVLVANHIQLALETFWLDGPNGRHLCFVLPLLGPKLTHVYKYYGHIPELIKDICFRLIEAMRFIHSRGLCHGDFRTDNILFRLADGVDEWDEDAMMKLLGKPRLVRVERVGDGKGDLEPGVPAHLFERADIVYGVGACSSDIAVIDFGVSYRNMEHPIHKGTGIPLPYAAPEEVFEQGNLLGFHTDIWALGVTIAKLRCGFAPFADEEYDDFLAGLRKMECIMGPIPNPLRTVWREWKGVFVNCQDENGKTRDDGSWEDESVFATVNTEEQASVEQSRNKEGRPGNYLHYRMHHFGLMDIDHKEADTMAAQAASDPGRLPPYDWQRPPLEYGEKVQHTMEKPEIDQMFSLLNMMFRWNPEQRATLDQIADHEWFGDRSSRQPVAPPSPPRPATNNKRPRSPSPLGSGKKPRCDGEAEANRQNDTPAVAGQDNGMDGLRGPAAWYSYVARIMAGLRNGAGWVLRRPMWCMSAVGKTFFGIVQCLRWQSWRFGRAGS